MWFNIGFDQLYVWFVGFDISITIVIIHLLMSLNHLEHVVFKMTVAILDLGTYLILLIFGVRDLRIYRLVFVVRLELVLSSG